MKQLATIIVISWAAALTMAASAQITKPRIVWSNLRERYEDLGDIKPRIELRNAKSVIWRMLDQDNCLWRYDETEKRWIEGNYLVDDVGPEYRQSIILEQNKPMDLFFHSEQFFERDKKRGYFFQSAPEYGNKSYPANGKYKILFYYGTNPLKPNVLDSVAESPTFLISGKY